jgi:hypothetical protein
MLFLLLKRVQVNQTLIWTAHSSSSQAAILLDGKKERRVFFLSRGRVKWQERVIAAPRSRRNLRYDPHLCKTCQMLKVDRARPARTEYSDCEEHFRERMILLSQRNVEIVIRQGKL